MIVEVVVRVVMEDGTQLAGTSGAETVPPTRDLETNVLRCGVAIERMVMAAKVQTGKQLQQNLADELDERASG